MKEWTWSVGKGAFIGSVTLLQASKEDAARYARPGYKGSLGFVSDLEVHPERRGQGWSNTLLSSLTAHADQNKIDLWTYVLPFGALFPGLKTKQLIKLYERHGFALVEDPVYEFEMLRRWQG